MSRAVSVVQLLEHIMKNRVNAGGMDAVLHKVKIIDGAKGKCVCELPVTEELTNVNGLLHGGATALLVDAVSTWALLTKTSTIPGVSVDMNISYIKGAPRGSEIIVNAQTIHVGRKLAFLTVDITNKSDGSIIAQGKHTKYIGETKES